MNLHAQAVLRSLDKAKRALLLVLKLRRGHEAVLGVDIMKRDTSDIRALVEAIK